MTLLRVVELCCSLCLQVTIVIACAAYLARRVVYGDRGRDRLWTVCLLAILLTTTSGLCLPHLRLLPTPAKSLDPQIGVQIEQHAGWLTAILTVWGCGAVVMLGRVAAGSWHAWRLLRKSNPIEPNRLPVPWGTIPLATHGAACASPGREIRFLSVSQAFSPFCWQWQRPTIVLPEVVLDFAPEEIAAVIRHEMAHLRYAHPLWLFLQHIVEAAFWFHPVVRWAGRHAIAAREFAADRHAARTPADAAALLRGLLHLTQFNCTRNGSRLAISAAGASPSLLAARARKLGAADSQESSGKRVWRWTWAPLAVALIATTLVWIPIDVAASSRSVWSPWPTWSARTLQALGIAARDYEIDGHRLRPFLHKS